MNGRRLQKEKFQGIPTSITHVGRGAIGERIMNQLAIMEGSTELLRAYWVGLSDGSIAQGRCQQFVE